MAAVNIQDVVRAAEQLSAMPASLLRVAAMLGSGRASIDEIAPIIRSDEVLAAAVLRRANSVSFAGAAGTFDLRQSIVRLGTRNLMHLIMELKASQGLANAGRAFGLRRGAMWRGAVGGAVAAEILARRSSDTDRDLCYVCSLLRDIGKLALEAYFRDGYLAFIEPHASPSRTFVECERLAIGFDHAQVGAALAARWGLPERVCAIIRRHHEPAPPGPGHDDAADIVHASDALCMWAGLAVGDDGLAYTIAPHVRGRLRLDRHTVEGEVAEVWMLVRQIELSLTTPPAQGVSA